MTIADTLPSNGNIFDGIKVLKQKQKILIQLPNQLYHGLKYPLFVLCKKVEIQTKKKTLEKSSSDLDWTKNHCNDKVQSSWIPVLYTHKQHNMYSYSSQ